MPSIYEMLRGRLGRPRQDENELGVETKLEELEGDVIDEGELISHVDKEFNRRKKERLPFENQWKLNINFLEGNQYVDINPVSQALEEIPRAYEWQEREVFDMIAPNIETRLSRLSRMRPLLKARPGSNDPDDLRSTKIGSQLLKNIYYDKKMQNKQADINAWMESTGTCLMKHVWNQDLGQIVGYDESVMDINGGQPQAVHEGDLESIVCPPQEIYPDSSYNQEVEDCRSIIHAKAFHVDQIEEIYGKKVQPEQLSVMQLQRAMIGSGGMGYNAMTHNYTTLAMKDYALVKEYWEMPTKDHPEGRLIVVANGILLYYLDHLPYMIGEDNKPALPFTKLVCIKRPGCFWGKSIVQRMIPLQRRYNAVRNRVAEYLNRVAVGQWTVEEESVDLDYMEANAGSPGAIIEHRIGSQPPRPVQFPGLPNEFQAEIANLLQEFSIVSGVSEISRQSNAPTGVKSGVALQLALEQDDTRLATTAENISNFLVECGKIWLRLYKQYANGPRVLRATGKNNLVEMMDWSGADIKSDDVIIEPYSAMIESPAQRKQMIFDLIQTGILNEGVFDKETRNKVLEIIDLGNWEDLDRDEELHISRAERETMSLKQGMMVFPAEYDDHILHVARHNNYRLTFEFEQLSAEYPEIAQMFNDHIQIHLLSLQEAALMQMQQQMQMQPQLQ